MVEASEAAMTKFAVAKLATSVTSKPAESELTAPETAKSAKPESATPKAAMSTKAPAAAKACLVDRGFTCSPSTSFGDCKRRCLAG